MTQEIKDGHAQPEPCLMPFCAKPEGGCTHRDAQPERGKPLVNKGCGRDCKGDCDYPHCVPPAPTGDGWEAQAFKDFKEVMKSPVVTNAEWAVSYVRALLQAREAEWSRGVMEAVPERAIVNFTQQPKERKIYLEAVTEGYNEAVAALREHLNPTKK
jgi:hypothetical protein